MIEQLHQTSEKVLGFKMSGKLHDEDYKRFVPLVDAAIAKDGKVRLLAQFHDFHGWDLHALWDDIKVGMLIRSLVAARGRVAGHREMYQESEPMAIMVRVVW